MRSGALRSLQSFPRSCPALQSPRSALELDCRRALISLWCWLDLWVIRPLQSEKPTVVLRSGVNILQRGAAQQPCWSDIRPVILSPHGAWAGDISVRLCANCSCGEFSDHDTTPPVPVGLYYCRNTITLLLSFTSSGTELWSLWSCKVEVTPVKPMFGLSILPHVKHIQLSFRLLI